MTGHTVCLPHPSRLGSIVATCSAGDWTITYEWGGHDDATDQAQEHVGDASATHPVVAEEMSGQRIMLPGRSR